VPALDDLLAQADAQPAYSAKIRIRTLLDDQLAAVTTGKANLNAKQMTGHYRFRTMATADSPASTVESVITARATYYRELGTGSQKGEWQKEPGSAAPIANAGGYARLLLKQGPDAVKGPEILDLTQITRLSGEISAEDVRDLEPDLYHRLRTQKPKSFSCDIWLNGSGRVVRLEEWFSLGGYSAHNVMELTSFGAPFKPKKPKSYGQMGEPHGTAAVIV